MLIEVLKSKIHRATINDKSLQYTGSITIDENLMDAAGMREYEKVLIANIQNGNRFETYVIKGERGGKVIGLNGAAARLGEIGDQIIIMSYAYIDTNETLTPQVVLVDEKNNIVESK